MSNRNKRLCGVVVVSIFLFFASSAWCADETLSVTTYYPSPKGNYKELSSIRMKIGATYSGSGTTVADNNLIVEGSVGIGSTSPSYKLTVNGTAWCTAGAWASDLRWKDNISTLDDPLEKLLRLRGVEFDWKRQAFQDRNFPEGRQIGMIAQEVEKEYPELVMTDKDGYKSLAYDKFTAILLEAVKAQQKEIESLRKRLDALEMQGGEREAKKE